MNTLILNREFKLPADGWYQVAPLGEFPHSASGVVQVVDAVACVSMVNRFNEEAMGENFAGLLIDFDHFSLDQRNKSEAAGWITGLEARLPGDVSRGDAEDAELSRRASSAISAGLRVLSVESRLRERARTGNSLRRAVHDSRS